MSKDDATMLYPLTEMTYTRAFMFSIFFGFLKKLQIYIYVYIRYHALSVSVNKIVLDVK